MTQLETDQTIKFDRPWREGRFTHAVQQDIALKKQQRDYIDQVHGDTSALVEQDFYEAHRVAAWGIWTAFVDILDYGEPDEIAQAREVITIFQEPKLQQQS